MLTIVSASKLATFRAAPAFLFRRAAGLEQALQGQPTRAVWQIWGAPDTLLKCPGCPKTEVARIGEGPSRVPGSKQASSPLCECITIFSPKRGARSTVLAAAHVLPGGAPSAAGN